MKKVKTKFIIFAEKDGITKYVLYDTVNGCAVATDDISLATPFPSKFVCNAVIKVTQPVIDRECPGCQLGVIEVQS